MVQWAMKTCRCTVLLPAFWLYQGRSLGLGQLFLAEFECFVIFDEIFIDFNTHQIYRPRVIAYRIRDLDPTLAVPVLVQKGHWRTAAMVHSFTKTSTTSKNLYMPITHDDDDDSLSSSQGTSVCRQQTESCMYYYGFLLYTHGVQRLHLITSLIHQFVSDVLHFICAYIQAHGALHVRILIGFVMVMCIKYVSAQHRSVCPTYQPVYVDPSLCAYSQRENRRLCVRFT